MQRHGRSNRIQWKEPVSALLLHEGVGAGFLIDGIYDLEGHMGSLTAVFSIDII